MTDTLSEYQENNLEIERRFALISREFAEIERAHEVQNELVLKLQQSNLSLFQEFINLSQKTSTEKYADILEANKWVAELKRDLENYNSTNRGQQASAIDVFEPVSHKDLLIAIRKSLRENQIKFTEILEKHENDSAGQPLVRALILEIVRLQRDNANLLNYFCAIHVRPTFL